MWMEVDDHEETILQPTLWKTVSMQELTSISEN